MLGVKKLLSSLLVLGISLSNVAVLPIVQPTQAQTKSQQQEIEKLLQQARQQTQQGNPQQAIATYQQVLALAQQLKDRKLEATTLTNIGVVYNNVGQPQKALEYYNQALPILREVRNRSVEATTLSNIGVVYRDTKQPSEAIKNFERSVQITLKIRGGLERTNRQQFLASNQASGIALVDLLIDILIRPIEAQIATNQAKQLSIIATGKLRYIPFETLIDRKTGKYLIEKYPVNNLTRLSTRSLQQTNKHKETLLALGNPFPNDGRSLQGAEDEVKSITPLLPGSENFLGAQATLDNFKIQAPRFPILHLATHGCFRPGGCPDLKLPANTILFRDRAFHIADAALLGLKNTDLVVLSACQTAVQANSNGEEFAGIAYLFERAGAKSVIASLWLAKDEETKDLMIRFYQNLKQGTTKGEALRQAKLSLIDKHPLYWSPFILIGDAR